MDKGIKLALGKVLGEVYRLQKRVEPKMFGRDDATIYGLLHGIETVIDEEFRSDGVSAQEHNSAAELLSNIWNEPSELEAFEGFYDIEKDLNAVGLDRAKAVVLFRYFASSGMFFEVLKKMDSDGSPLECRTFELTEHDR